MLGYYDLARCPPTFDVVTFLLRLEQERIRRGEESVEIEILPGPVGGFRDDKLWPHSIEERRALLHNIVVPMCTMLPSAKRVTVRHDRPAKPEPGSFGFGEYSMQFAHFIAAIGKVRPLRAARGSPYDPQMVTITLRECEHRPERNNRSVPDWCSAAERLVNRGYTVVVVRDTANADHQLRIPGVCTAPAASRDLWERAKLYGTAACNLFVSNGPAWFCMALDEPAIVFRPATEGLSFNYSARVWERNGVPSGGQIPGAPPYQRLVWKDDTAENIIEEACRFCEQQQAA